MRHMLLSLAIVMASVVAVQGQTPASKPTTTTSAPAKTIESPEMILEMYKPPVPPEKRPDWGSLTGIQKEKLLQEYKASLARMKADPGCRGQKVAWSLTIGDITPAKEGEGAAKVEARSADGSIVIYNLPSGTNDSLLKLKKGAQVLVSGTIKEYAIGEAAAENGLPALRAGQFAVLLEGATLAERPTVDFFGLEIDADDIVFAIDRSGSMLDTFDRLRISLWDTIDRMKADRRFHVIFFSVGTPKELPLAKLIPPTDENKKKTREFLGGISPQGQTDPLTALTRAFVVLNAGPRGRTKAIVLVTDGAFPSNTKVHDLIKSRNTGNLVKVYTVLLGDQEKDAAPFLEKLAKEFGGKFKMVAGE